MVEEIKYEKIFNGTVREQSKVAHTFKESLYIWEHATCSYHVCCLITFIMIINFQIVKKKSLLYLICPTLGI